MDNNFREILDRQKQTTDLLEKEVGRLESLDVTKQNAALEIKVGKLNAELETLRAKIAELSKDNSALKDTLYSKMYAEKLAIIGNSQKKLDTYFAVAQNGGYDRLTSFEKHYTALIDGKVAEIRGTGTLLNGELGDKVTAELAKWEELSKEVETEIAAAKNNIDEMSGIQRKMRGGYDGFRDERVSDEDMAKVVKQSSFERIIGLNVINKIGIILIIIGVIAASQYTYRLLNDIAKGGAIFLLGIVMVVFGEFLSRKKSNVFSLGMTAGGVAVIYAALTISYFHLNILGVYPAALLCVIITAGAFFLSVKHSSQVIATFALIGGYLPLLTVSGSLNYTLTFSAMAYFIVLGGFALGLAFKRKWLVTAFFGLSLNIIAAVYISTFFTAKSPGTDKIILISYIVISFVIYTLIPIISTFVGKLRFKKSDVALIAVNIFSGTLILYWLFARLELTDLNGLIAIIFMFANLALWGFISKKMPTERDMGVLFYITSMVFFALIIPMQFDVIWLTLGWLIEGLALTVYGILRDNKKFRAAGLVISGLCVCSFVIFDLFNYFNAEYFTLKYLLITLGALLIPCAFIFRRAADGKFSCDNRGKAVNILKYCASVNLWVFLLYIIAKGFEQIDFPRWYNESYLYMAACVSATFALGFILPRIKAFCDKGVEVISIGLHIIGIGWLFGMSFVTPLKPLYRGVYDTFAEPGSSEVPTNVKILASLVLIEICLLSIIALADIVSRITKKGKVRIEWLPFILSCYFMVILTQNLIVYYEVPFAGMLISLIYAALALLWCIFGFWKRFTFMRRFGLIVALLAVAKLFIIDLWSLTEGYRIIVYFALGVALIAISFVYQYFTKKIENL